MNLQCRHLKSAFPATHMFRIELLIYSRQFFFYCIQSCSWQHQNLDFHLETDVLNHIKAIQTTLQPGGQDAPLPPRLHQVKHQAQAIAPAVLPSPLHYRLFWALPSKLFHHIHNSSRILIFIKHFERPWFHPKGGKGSAVITVCSNMGYQRNAILQERPSQFFRCFYLVLTSKYLRIILPHL